MIGWRISRVREADEPVAVDGSDGVEACSRRIGVVPSSDEESRTVGRPPPGPELQRPIGERQQRIAGPVDVEGHGFDPPVGPRYGGEETTPVRGQRREVLDLTDPFLCARVEIEPVDGDAIWGQSVEHDRAACRGLTRGAYRWETLLRCSTGPTVGSPSTCMRRLRVSPAPRATTSRASSCPPSTRKRISRSPRRSNHARPPNV